MKIKKLTLAATLLLTTSFLFSGCGGTKPDTATKPGTARAPTPEATKMIWRLAETQPVDHPTTLGDKKFAELVKEHTNGRIAIEVFPSGQLGEEKAAIEQVQMGALELTRVNASPLAEFNKNFGALSLPYVFDNDEHLWKFLKSDAGNKLLDEFESTRMKGLAYYSSGSRSFYSRKPITSLADLKGLKIRVQQSKVTIDMISALGANATPMAYGEVFGALQAGVIDAAENNFPSFLTSSHFQCAKNMILDEHQRTPEVLLISKAAWDKLSDEDKKLIKQAAMDSVDFQRQEWTKFEKDAEKKLRDAGVTITPVKDVKAWQDAVKPIIEQYGADYKEVLDAITAARK